MKDWKTLGVTTWDKIKVGEVFAFFGCCGVLYKESKNGSILLSEYCSDSFLYYDYGEKRNILYYKYDTLHLNPVSMYNGMSQAGKNGQIHKLPVSIQRNFIEWEES